MTNLTASSWNCLARAFAAIGVTVDHDGSEIIWPGFRDPYCRKAFHIQEFINASYNQGILVVPFEVSAQSSPPMKGAKPHNYDFSETVKKVMAECDGVAIGTLPDGRRHASAWINGAWINGLITVEVFYAVVKS